MSLWPVVINDVGSCCCVRMSGYVYSRTVFDAQVDFGFVTVYDDHANSSDVDDYAMSCCENVVSSADRLNDYGRSENLDAQICCVNAYAWRSIVDVETYLAIGYEGMVKVDAPIFRVNRYAWKSNANVYEQICRPNGYGRCENV